MIIPNAVVAVLGLLAAASQLAAAEPAAMQPEERLSAYLENRPAAKVLEVAYEASPPVPAHYTPPQIELAILARRNGNEGFRALSDGEELVSEVDDYVIALRPYTPGYVYVFQIDSSGKAEWLFPRNDSSKFSSGSNPIVTEQVIQVPDKRVLFLDQTAGIEHIYTIFAASRWPELEVALYRESAVSFLAGSQSKQRSVKEPNAMSHRGVAGTRFNPPSGDPEKSPSLKQILDCGSRPLPSGSELYTARGSFIVLERWLTHVE